MGQVSMVRLWGAVWDKSDGPVTDLVGCGCTLGTMDSTTFSTGHSSLTDADRHPLNEWVTIDILLTSLVTTLTDVGNGSLPNDADSVDGMGIESQLAVELSESSGVDSEDPPESCFPFPFLSSKPCTLCVLASRDSCCKPLGKLRLELADAGLESGCESKICTWRSRPACRGIATPVRMSCLGGTPTLRDVGEGEVDSSAWMCASTSGMEITKFAIGGEKRARSRHDTYVYALMFSGLISV